MSASPFKLILILVVLAAGGFSIFYATKGRAPACEGGGKYMSTLTECRAWGLDASICATAIENARTIAGRAAPKTETMFQCETRFSDCFENPAGGFTPRPSFCLKSSAEPSELRYLEFEADRRNRRVTKEVRIN